MATCLRGGKRYLRHQWAPGVSEVDGTTTFMIVCKMCGKEQVEQIKLDKLAEVMVDLENETETV